MIGADTFTAIASTAGVTAVISWRFFIAFNSKADKTTTTEIFKMLNVDRKEIAELSKTVAVMGRDVQGLTAAIGRVDRNVETILKNGK